MTVLTPLGPEQAAKEILFEAEAHYQRSIVMLEAIIQDVKAGQLGRTKELKGALRDLHSASQTAFDERAKVEKRIRAEAGILNDYALDLDEARSEIRSRLDRLRNAGGSGDISEQP